MKKLNQFLNILLSILLGIFIGNCIFTVMDHQMNPAAYAAQSAPWYTGLLTQGLFVLAAVVIFMTVKIVCGQKRGCAKPSGLDGFKDRNPKNLRQNKERGG